MTTRRPETFPADGFSYSEDELLVELSVEQMRARPGTRGRMTGDGRGGGPNCWHQGDRYGRGWCQRHGLGLIAEPECVEQIGRIAILCRDFVARFGQAVRANVFGFRGTGLHRHHAWRGDEREPDQREQRSIDP